MGMHKQTARVRFITQSGDTVSYIRTRWVPDHPHRRWGKKRVS